MSKEKNEFSIIGIDKTLRYFFDTHDNKYNIPVYLFQEITQGFRVEYYSDNTGCIIYDTDGTYMSYNINFIY